MGVTKKEHQKLIAVLLGSIVTAVVLAILVNKFGLIERLIVFAREEIILSMCVVVPLMLCIYPQVFYTLSMSLIPSVVDGIVVNKVLGILPIYNAVKISQCYYESELTGILGKLPIVTEIITVLIYVGGLIYLYIKDGFFMFTPAIITWAAVLFGAFVINNIVKSVCLGKITASFNDVIPLRAVQQYYLVPLIGGILVIGYYLLIPTLTFFGVDASGLIKSTLINIITILLPFFLPMYTMFTSRRVLKMAYAFFMKNSGN